jgi:hypothetical protein
VRKAGGEESYYARFESGIVLGLGRSKGGFGGLDVSSCHILFGCLQHSGTGLMVTYSSMPGKKMLTPVVVAGSPELGLP